MKHKKQNVLSTVWHTWKPAFKANALAITLTFVFYNLSAFFAEMLKPVFWKNIFDQLNTGQDPMKWFYLVVVCFACSFVCSRLGDFFITIAEANIIKRLQDISMLSLLKKSKSFFGNNFNGSLVAKSKRFSKESGTIIDHLAYNLSKSAILVVYVLTYTMYLIPQVGIIFLVWVIIFLLSSNYLSKIRLKRDIESSEKDSATTAIFSDIISSLSYLRVFSREFDEYEKFKKVSAEEEYYRKRAWFLGNLQMAAQSFLTACLEICVMYVLIKRVAEGKETIGTLAMAQMYVLTLSMYMRNVGQSLVRIRTSLADAYEMSEIIKDTKNETETVTKPKNIKPLSNSICFENVDFGYSQEEKILKDFSFRFEPGKHYGLIGQSGAGKSTVLSLLLREHDLQKGTISIGDIKTESEQKADIRSLIAYVPQHPSFPSRKIIDILRIGKENATKEEMVSVCEKAGCQFIWQKFPDGFETFVGERGVKLSGGEAQRLAIATAMLKDAPIVIMDEPTSALDAETEQIIQTSITKHFKGKTMIVIAHRLATVAVLDEIVVLENGEVANSAPHKKLLDESKIYSRMWSMQTSPSVLLS